MRARGLAACLRSLSGMQRAGAGSGGAGSSPALPVEEGIMAQWAGRRRKLTDAQIQEVLAWHAKGRWSFVHAGVLNSRWLDV